MGLGIGVGSLAELLEDDPEGAQYIQAALNAVNRLLAEHGLPPHMEPNTLPALKHRARITSFPYSFIHYLRRASAHRRANPDWMAAPLADGEDPIDDPVLQGEKLSMNSHLIWHSDAEGFYLPVDFSDVLVAKDDGTVPGRLVGSSFHLMRELSEVAPALGIRLVDGQLTDDEANRIDKRLDADDGLTPELASWILLFECARLSIEHRTAIVFC